MLLSQISLREGLGERPPSGVAEVLEKGLMKWQHGILFMVGLGASTGRSRCPGGKSSAPFRGRPYAQPYTQHLSCLDDQ